MAQVHDNFGQVVSQERLESVINQFLDNVDRPVGKLAFSIKSDLQTNQAILALFDAVGRNP